MYLKGLCELSLFLLVIEFIHYIDDILFSIAYICNQYHRNNNFKLNKIIELIKKQPEIGIKFRHDFGS